MDFYFSLVLWTRWLLLVVKVATAASEDLMANQVPFGQLSWMLPHLVVVVVVVCVVSPVVSVVVVVVVACFVSSVVSFVVLVPRQMTRLRKSLRRSQMNPLGLIFPVVVPHLVLLEHESLDPVSGNPKRSQAVVVNFQTHPLVVVRQLAYVWQFFLQRLSVWHPNPRIWIQSGLFD